MRHVAVYRESRRDGPVSSDKAGSDPIVVYAMSPICRTPL
jgi:hypothetical protein